MLTKDRIAPTLAVLAAIVGLVLVFSTPHSDADDDDAPATPSTSQVVPAPGGQLPSSVAPAPGQPPAVSQAPAAPKKDDDGDDDDDDDN